MRKHMDQNSKEWIEGLLEAIDREVAGSVGETSRFVGKLHRASVEMRVRDLREYLGLEDELDERESRIEEMEEAVGY